MSRRDQPCPCGRPLPFPRCCRRWHRNRKAPDPESLMRSRYAAYATGNAGYILATTDPEGPLFRADRAAWLAEIRAFCQGTEFLGLSVLDASQDNDQGEVRFQATLVQDGQDASLRERSRFRCQDGRWLYVDGQPF